MPGVVAPPNPALLGIPTQPVEPVIPVRPERTPKMPPPETPQCTLYIRNLLERRNLKIVERELNTIFSRFGKVLEIKVLKGIRMKGQAFVVFEDQESADKAKNQMQGFPLHDKKMDIQYSRWMSDVAAKKAGILETHVPERRKDKLVRIEEYKKKQAELEASGLRPPAKGTDEYTPPNSLLLVQNFPQDIITDDLAKLFMQYPGYKEIRLIQLKGVAFVQFENEQQSEIAKKALHGYRISADHEIKVTFAKK
ncbi:hypothetical protein HK098_003631 [Nowakowskiella sp. JEL0407]|nr:hypothetical protein HK098_003631 [Nowakowskiella sp. JEL0407]